MPLPAHNTVIAVMGVTGSGKSSFIRGITGNGDVKVGVGLRSETSEIQSFSLRTPSGAIGLVDTPGFDDTERPDFEILKQLASWLQRRPAEEQSLAGILFLHPIIHNRLQGSSRRMLSMFNKLLGEDYFRKVLLITTFWNDVAPDVGEQRERELTESCDAWKPMISAGARVERMGRDYVRFIPLLEGMAARSAPSQLLIQTELNRGVSLEQTMAGLLLNSAHREQSRRLQELKDLTAAVQGPDPGAPSSQHEDAGQARLAAYRRRYEEEVRNQQLENDRILAEMRERESRQTALRQQRRRELEEQIRVEGEIRRARERDQKNEEARRLKATYEAIADLQARASRHLEAHACEVIDSIRAYSATETLPVSVHGIQQEGIGFFGANGPGAGTKALTA
ncbi:P-loop containing nucleoside triphosphate hydrolase protein [Chaetomium sp. MPI-CAGE-AT-0009]|nr:P-loop containing nucleoside triphosphate hydrolase protein [Chaetomium sp. MPI-CAGE-AT-0009]